MSHGTLFLTEYPASGCLVIRTDHSEVQCIVPIKALNWELGNWVSVLGF